MIPSDHGSERHHGDGGRRWWDPGSFVCSVLNYILQPVTVSLCRLVLGRYHAVGLSELFP